MCQKDMRSGKQHVFLRLDTIFFLPGILLDQGRIQPVKLGGRFQ